MNPFDLFSDRKAFVGTVLLRLFSLRKIPMILYLRPTILVLSRERVVLRIPLRRRSKNQLGTMYFGALATGADVAGALLGLEAIRNSHQPVDLVFKDMSAQFLRRAEGDVHFTCDDGILVQDLVEKTLETGERQEVAVTVTATVPSKLGEEPVAAFILTLSVKYRAQRSSKAAPIKNAKGGKKKQKKLPPKQTKARTKRR